METIELAYIPAFELSIGLHEGGDYTTPSLQLLEGIAVQQHYHAWNRGEDVDQCVECDDGARFAVCRNLWIAPAANTGAYCALRSAEGTWYKNGTCASCIARGIECSMARYKVAHEEYERAKTAFDDDYDAAVARGRRARATFLRTHRRPTAPDSAGDRSWNYQLNRVPPECEMKTGP